MNISQLLGKIQKQKDLSRTDARAVFDEMMCGKLSTSEIERILRALYEKGESVEEILGCVDSLRAYMLGIDVPFSTLDTCGTGGDGKSTYNISTTVAFIARGAGISIAKHGNRKVTSACGSADVLEELGVNIGLSREHALEVLKCTGIVFLFAPLYHKTLRHVAEARRNLKTRSIFNYVGPFCNPAGTARQVIGVPDTKRLVLLTRVAELLNYEAVALVTSQDGIDEVGIIKPSTAHILRKGMEHEVIKIQPQAFGMNHSDLDLIQGGDCRENAMIIRSVLRGEKGAYRDVAILNAALAIYLSGRVATYVDGVSLAANSIDSGNAFQALQNLIQTSRTYENIY